MTLSANPGSSHERRVVHVDLGQRSYDIVIGSKLLEEAGGHIAPILRRPFAAIVTDKNVARLHLETLEKSLAAAGIKTVSIVIDPGEASKSFPVFERLVASLLEAGVERRDMVIAFGGGVIGDLAGFASSVLRRGVDFIQIPTTLLAQVDSSVGGKTGINTAHGKNLVGAFHQPRLVLADTSLLDTLAPRELRSGYAEVIKYGLIDDAPFFEWLERHGAQVLSTDGPERLRAVETSCLAKARIVSEDERESGARALLNLGHTFGHALEAITGYSDKLLHGEGVAIGCRMAYGFSAMLDLCDPKADDRIASILEASGLPASASAIEGAKIETPDMLTHMAQDKKVVGGQLTFILAKGIGKSFVAPNIASTDVARYLDTVL